MSDDQLGVSKFTALPSGHYPDIIYRRGWTDDPIFRRGTRISRAGAFLWLADHAIPNRGGTQGEILISVRSLAKKWRWSSSTVHRYLTRLSDEGIVRRELSGGRTKITLLEFVTYPGSGGGL